MATGQPQISVSPCASCPHRSWGFLHNASVATQGKASVHAVALFVHLVRLQLLDPQCVAKALQHPSSTIKLCL